MARLKDLQINLRKRDPTLNLARQTVSELAVVGILVSKQPRCPMNTPAWLSSSDSRIAIAIPAGSNAVTLGSGRGRSMV